MAYIMDMASGTKLAVEEPSYQLKRDSRNMPLDASLLAEYPQLQLAMVEVQTQTEAASFHASVVEAAIETLED